MAERHLTGPQKAAVLLLQFDTKTSAQVLKNLRETEVAEIMAEVARLRKLESSAVDIVLHEFVDLAERSMVVTSGGLELARTMLYESMGEEKADDILGRVSAGVMERPFEFLRRTDVRQVLSFLQDEHPQTIALVLAHLPAEDGAHVLSGFDEDMQADVARRLATMDRTSPEVIEQVERVLERKLSSVMQPGEMTSVGGVQALVDILNRTERATEKHILEGLETENPDLADAVRDLMFVFEDITTLDDRSIQLILRNADSKDLAVALKGVKDDVRDKIMRNLSQRAAENLADEISLLGPTKLKTVEEAQGRIVRAIRALETSGQLVMARGNDEFID